MGKFMNAKDELMEELKAIGKTLENIIAIAIMVEGIVVSSVLDIDQLDLRYDSGFGGQELFGMVLFDDDSWLERQEYDGSEWWTLKVAPEILDIETQARIFRKMIKR